MEILTDNGILIKAGGKNPLKTFQQIVLVCRKGFLIGHILISSISQKFSWKIHFLTKKYAFSVRSSIRIMMFSSWKHSLPFIGTSSFLKSQGDRRLDYSLGIYGVWILRWNIVLETYLFPIGQPWQNSYRTWNLWNLRHL